ncbi:MAG: histidinol-phosphate transaminase [Actinomycetota bacterium]
MKIKKWIMELPDYIPGSTLEDIKRKYGLKKVYKLASNENILGPAPQVKEAICRAVDNVNYYPDANCSDLRQKLSKTYGLPAENIIIGNGTDQIIEMLCDCFIGPGNNIVIADPTFLIYEKAALKCGGSVKKIPLKDYRQDVGAMVSGVLEDTSMIFFTSPHNPTGTNITREEFKFVLDNVDRDVLVVIDEAYCEYVQSEDSISSLNYVRDFPNLVLLRTFSKIFGLAGLRTGFGIAHRQVIDALNKIRLPFNVNSLGQAGASAALDYLQYIQEAREKVTQEKEKFYAACSDNGIGFIRSYANFILLKTGKYSPEIVQGLLREGFIVRPGSNLGVDGFIRVTVSVADINELFLEKFLEIYKKYY